MMPGTVTSMVPTSHWAWPVLPSLSPGLKKSLENRKNKSADFFFNFCIPRRKPSKFHGTHSNPKVKNLVYDWSSFGWRLCAVSFRSNTPRSISCHRVRDEKRRNAVSFLHHGVFLNGNACGTTMHYSNWLA